MLSLVVQADVALLRLPAPSLRGTFSKAYSLLTRLVSQIGWDELLRTRSSVFVMEEEYRQQKAKPEPAAAAGDVGGGNARDSQEAPQGVNGGGAPAAAADGSPDGLDTPGHAIPTIKISSESDRDQEEAHELEASSAATAAGSDGDVTPPALEKPELAQHPADDKESGADAAEGAVHDDAAAAAGDPEPDDKFSFSTKRLCERWLDNLFMVLYEVRRLSGVLPVSAHPLTLFLPPSPRARRTCACTRSGGPRSRTSRRSTCRTAKPGPRCVGRPSAADVSTLR